MKTELVVLEESPASEVKVARHSHDRSGLLERVRHARLWNQPWLGWAFVYASVILFCFIYRSVTLTALIMMYGTEEDCYFGVEIAILALGVLEDIVCATFLASGLWIVDTINRFWLASPVDVDAAETTNSRKLQKILISVFVLVSSWILFVLVVGPVAVDLMLVRLRGVRFTLEEVASTQENAALDDMTTYEVKEMHATVVVTVCMSGLFALVRTFASWPELTRWSPSRTVIAFVMGHFVRTESRIRVVSTQSSYNDAEVDIEDIVLEDRAQHSGTNTPSNLSFCHLEIHDSFASSSSINAQQTKELLYQRVIQTLVALIVVVLVALIGVAVSAACPSLVAFSALNATLNELLAHVLGDTSQSYLPAVSDGSTPWVETFIHSATENYTLFQDDSLYRRTTGFHGGLAFDVNVTNEDPPNVLLIVVESFRFHDSHYLVGDDDPSDLFKGTNITITPNFDKWAKRGIALTNFWSSWRTSRSVESLQYAQLPYDSVDNSGMTGGKTDIELAGLPQLFKAKGYDPFFTTGCQTEYDDWKSFLPAHGFDTVWSRDEMMKLAESDLNVSSDQWYGDEQRGLYWGVHDDLSFQLLGDLLVNKTREQRDRVAQGEDKKPVFLTHYTISSHTPFAERPKWYAEAEKPDFSALYEGEEYADLIKNYLEMRYFTDMELGKFMDRMSEEGILNDTIVVISGDHGQAPEFGYDAPEARDLSVTRVAGALIAEGRLGEFRGLRLEDAAEQYDILNTLADVTGVPEGGFLQDGVGRSLKRSSTFGERVVYSNNPSRKMSVIRGNKRLQYDRHSSDVLLHDSRVDHDMLDDLFPTLGTEEQDEWVTQRSNGRWLNTYYTSRWDQKCLLAAEC
ncbi:hypothetical protein PRIC2_010440 [Phytophthora ramorum]